MNQIQKILFLAVILCSFLTAQSQGVLKGKVTDASTGEAVEACNVSIVGTTIGSITNEKGEYTISISEGTYTVEFLHVAYGKLIREVVIKSGETTNINAQLEDASFGDMRVVVGSRFKPRTVVTSAVPIDNIQVEDLAVNAQTSIDKMLHYSVPSFNSTQQTISDATAHFDPADLRGLGPARTLVLINGKRKNASALVYINDTPGKGDVGVDMGSIPSASIKRIEVLRDGASAQYGSDAIAGVLNIVLKDQVNETKVNANSGVTSEGDGFQYGLDLNSGFKLKENGFFNYTLSHSWQDETNRAPSPGKDLLFGNIYSGLTLADVGGDAAVLAQMHALGASLLDGSEPWLKANPSMGMHVGLPQMRKTSFVFNSAMDSGEGKMYMNGGYVSRSGLSYALYRTPYWKSDDHHLLHDVGTEYQGYQPTFETETKDFYGTIGTKSSAGNLAYDLSVTAGKNTVDYNVNESQNYSLGANSPTSFNVGGYEFSHLVLNADASSKLSNQTILNLGAEFRAEIFKANAGDKESYEGEGTQSFPGLQQSNEVDEDRSNIGMYASIDHDVNTNLFFSGALRYEDYSDFGANTSFKVSTRYKLDDESWNFRGSFSTAFRAPSLHQRFMSNKQTLLAEGVISDQGTFNNESQVLRDLGVDKLKDEKSTNFSFGFAATPSEGLFFSADYFIVNLEDRIVYSSSIGKTKDANGNPTPSTLNTILDNNRVVSLKFFINGVDTKTSGLDIVANYKKSNTVLNFAASFYDHEIDGKIKTSDVLINAGKDVFDRKEQGRLLSARPNSKIILGITRDYDALSMTFTATRFGEVTWQDIDPANDQTFEAKILFDLFSDYEINEQMSLSLGISNLFDTYPDELDPKGNFATNLGGRFKYAWEVNQFGFNGRTILGTLNINL